MLKLPVNTDLQMTWYNTSHALWMAGFSIQQLLVTWILVGILDQSPETVGLAQLLIGVPALIFMLWGGVIGDRVDGRGLLIQSHLLSIIPPLVLALAVYLDQLGVWILILTALVANLLNSASNPARNTILNLVAGGRLQWAISLSTGIGAIATMIGHSGCRQHRSNWARSSAATSKRVFWGGRYLFNRIARKWPINRCPIA